MRLWHVLWAFLNGKALFIADEIMQIKLRSLTIWMVGERGVLDYSKHNLYSTNVGGLFTIEEHVYEAFFFSE